MGTWYTTREDVMSAQDIKATAYAGRDIDRAIESASRMAEELLHRDFAPWTGTRSFDYPNDQGSPSWRLWFGQYGLISPTVIANNDGTTVALSDWFLWPQDGPPYEALELNRGTNAAFSSGSTSQRSVSITGLWGYTNQEDLAGTVTEPLDASETEIDGNGMPTVGVGTVIRVDSERMIVTDKRWLATGQTGTLAVQQNAQALTVADGTAFVAGETLLMDAERIRVVDIAGNTLTLRRAVDGTTLSAHSSSAIFALRQLTVRRGALGTAAATHLTSAPVYQWMVPGPLAELTLAYAIDHLLQRQSGYARTIGSGDAEQEQTGRGIRLLEKRVQHAVGRQARKSVV
jgi:hypothetical protein